MSLFIRVDCSFFRHRKTLRLRAFIGDDALWVPPALWAYAAEHQPDGDFKDYSDKELALAIGYTKDAQALLQALLQACFLDASRMIHDWPEHNGYHIAHKERARKAAVARWDKEKERTKERLGTEEEKRGEESARARRSAPSNASSMLQASEVLSPEQVFTHVMTSGIPHDFVHWVYADWSSRQHCDGSGVPVEIVSYVQKRWVREQGEWKTGAHKGTRVLDRNGKPQEKSIEERQLDAELRRLEREERAEEAKKKAR